MTGQKPTGPMMVELLGSHSEPWACCRAAWSARIQHDSSARELFQCWRELRSMHSADPGDADLFVRHTYLALVARLMAARLLGPTTAFSNPTPDLFSWPAAGEPVEAIMNVLAGIDLRCVESDILKPLHHALTEPSSRRHFGEVYTPDWLAEWMVEDLMHGDSERVLDPACGSGTFLFFAIRKRLSQVPPAADPASTVLSTIHGADVNPVAVELARTNYVLALAPRLEPPAGPLDIPIFERDSLATEPAAPYDLILGNPPWIPLRALPPARQAEMKRLALAHRLTSGRGEMATHLETATIFLTHVADTSLAPGGRISFVLPRTVFTAEQHDPLRRGALSLPGSPRYSLQVESALDCEGVAPLFPTPAAVLTCRKTLSEPGSGFPLTRLEGRLPSGDLRLTEARNYLTTTESRAVLHTAGARSWWANEAGRTPVAASPYKSRFRQGATLVPRSFWFVDMEGPGRHGNIRIGSARRAKAGPVTAYATSALAGEVEPCFLFSTVLGDDLLPFVARRFSAIVLPASESRHGIAPADSSELEREGHSGMARWMREAERIWREVRGAKAGLMTLTERLDHVRGLSSQRTVARWRVLYPNFQRAAVACVVDSQDRRLIGPGRFVADTATYAFETDDEAEAGYLCALLNSRPVDERLQPLRRRDQAAHPNVHKKVFDVAPIPLFDPSDPIHCRLADAGSRARRRMNQHLSAGEGFLSGDIAAVRRAVREMMAEPLAEIDSRAEELLSREQSITSIT